MHSVCLHGARRVAGLNRLVEAFNHGSASRANLRGHCRPLACMTRPPLDMDGHEKADECCHTPHVHCNFDAVETQRLRQLEVDLLHGMRAHGFCSADRVTSGQVSEVEKSMLLDLIDVVKQRAVTPISGFHVGAVGITEEGNLCAGVNIEFPGLPLSMSIHAEQYLTVMSLRQPDRLHLVAVSAAPCGHCRQFVSELPQADSLAFIFRGYTDPVSLDTILPHRFRPTDLQEATHLPSGCAPLQGPHTFLLPPETASVATRRQSGSREAGDFCGGPEPDDPSVLDWPRLVEAAGSVAVASHAPYTGSCAGVALLLVDGTIARGFAIESAAYNPTLSPLHVALITVHSARRPWTDIVAAALAERPSAPVHYAGVFQDVLRIVAPDAAVRVSHLN